MRVQLLYFPGCPNVVESRAALQKSLATCGLQLNVEEVDVTAPDTPKHLQGWGSPTILIDGKDVADQVAGEGASCRVYRGEGQITRGVPSEKMIRRALTPPRGSE